MRPPTRQKNDDFKVNSSTEILLLNSVHIPHEQLVKIHEYKLAKGEFINRGPPRKVKNRNRYHWSADHEWLEFQVKGSVIWPIFGYVFLATIWAAIVSILYIEVKLPIAVPNLLVSVLAIVVGLTLVFRTNSAYDRYYEARKLWGSLKTHSRNLARFFVFGLLKSKSTERDELEKRGTLNLILAFAVAIKHSLRNEKGIYYDDLYPLLMHLPAYKPGHEPSKKETQPKIPLEISYHLTQRIYSLTLQAQLDSNSISTMLTTISNMIDVMTNLDRIQSSPIPLAYAIHLRQTVLIYIIALPFQLISGMGYSTIPAVTFAAFTLLGIEAVRSYLCIIFIFMYRLERKLKIPLDTTQTI